MYIICYIIHNYKKLYTHIYIIDYISYLYIKWYPMQLTFTTSRHWEKISHWWAPQWLHDSARSEGNFHDGRANKHHLMLFSSLYQLLCCLSKVPIYFVNTEKILFAHNFATVWHVAYGAQQFENPDSGARELLCGSLHDTKSMTQHCTFYQT